MSEPSSKRQRIESPLTVKQSHWWMRFFGTVLGCDMPILEALYNTTFAGKLLFFDLVSPRRLWKRIKADPVNELMYKDQWWDRFKKLITPIIEKKFPPTSVLSQFARWVRCSKLHHKAIEECTHYPLYSLRESCWELVCIGRKPDTDDDRNPWVSRVRCEVWELLETCGTLYYNTTKYSEGRQAELLSCHPGGEWMIIGKDLILANTERHLGWRYFRYECRLALDELCALMDVPEIVMELRNIEDFREGQLL